MKTDKAEQAKEIPIINTEMQEPVKVSAKAEFEELKIDDVEELNLNNISMEAQQLLDLKDPEEVAKVEQPRRSP